MIDSILSLEVELKQLAKKIVDMGICSPLVISGFIKKIAARAQVLHAGGVPMPYIVGNRYQRHDGSWVQIVGESKESETVYDESGRHYYNRPGDRGRLTGSAHDYSDLQNLIRLYAYPGAPASECGEPDKLGSVPSSA